MFFGPMALTTEDPNHGEQRFVTLGADGLGRLLVVVCTWRDDACPVFPPYFAQYQR